MFAIVAVFVAGLMVGRTPEYLGKKIEAFEMKMASLAILIPPLVVLGGTAVAVLVDAGRAGVANPGAHGFSEILYAFSSAGNNNGSAFAGLSREHAVLQHGARHRDAVRALLARRSRCSRSPARWPRRRRVPAGAGTLPTHTPLFVVVLVGVGGHRRRADVRAGARARARSSSTCSCSRPSERSHPEESP